MSPPLPEGKFGAILADPPWNFETYSGPAIPSRAAVAPYEGQEIEYIASLPVGDLAADDCVLFMWVTWPLLFECKPVLDAWGFKYSTCAFVWVKTQKECPRKPRMGQGYWTRANTEPCLLATRGEPQRLYKGVRQVIVTQDEWANLEPGTIAAPIREHSRKPDETHERIERLVAGKYLELFARKARPGWTTWGNETGKFDELTLPLEVA